MKTLEQTSAVLNIGAAISDLESARDAWMESNWNAATMWISNAISKLESAKAKIYDHQEKPDDVLADLEAKHGSATVGIDPCVNARGFVCHPVSLEESPSGDVWRCRRCGKIIEMESPNTTNV